MHVRLFSHFLIFFICLGSCAEKPHPIQPPEKNQSKLVGRIASIHQKPSFVLIQSYGLWNIETGAILATVGADGRSANLRVTGEKTGQFAAADIQSGTIEVGDAVYTTLSNAKKTTAEFEPIPPIETPPAPPQP